MFKLPRSTKHQYRDYKQTNKQYLCKQTNKKIVTRFNQNITNIITYIKAIFKNIIINKRYVKCSGLREQLCINTRNINKQIVFM